MNYATNLGGADTLFTRKRGLARVALGVLGADVSDIGGQEFGSSVALTGTGALVSALRLHVLHVVKMRASNQVRGIAARGVVAVVSYLQARWDRAVREAGRNAVGLQRLAMRVENSIPVLIVTTQPGPASIGSARFIYFAKKAHNVAFGEFVHINPR